MSRRFALDSCSSEECRLLLFILDCCRRPAVQPTLLAALVLRLEDRKRVVPTDEATGPPAAQPWPAAAPHPRPAWSACTRPDPAAPPERREPRQVAPDSVHPRDSSSPLALTHSLSHNPMLTLPPAGFDLVTTGGRLAATRARGHLSDSCENIAAHALRPLLRHRKGGEARALWRHLRPDPPRAPRGRPRRSATVRTSAGSVWRTKIRSAPSSCRSTALTEPVAASSSRFCRSAGAAASGPWA